jgi:hypothetical protein
MTDEEYQNGLLTDPIWHNVFSGYLVVLMFTIMFFRQFRFRRGMVLLPLLLSSFNCFPTNRIAGLPDRQIYGEYITPGDLIIDTPTKVTSTGNELVYYFMAKQWPTLREGATIWLDGKRLGKLSIIKFCNTASPLEPWHVQSVKFKNIPTTQVVAMSFFSQGLKNFELNGETSSYTGLSSWPKERKFLTGSFGFHIINKTFGGHGFNIAVLDKGTIKMNGFECQHGFSGVRINGGDYDITLEGFEMTNFYIHDTGDGEGLYLGATHKPPYAKIKNVIIYNGVITRTAAESLQLQHLAGGAFVHHVTIRSANVRWMNAFRAGQDTGIQWSIDAGTNKLYNIIVDGFASVGMIPFGNEGTSATSESYVSNILFNDGIDTGIYLHKSASHGVKWIFDNIFYRSFTSQCYYEGTGRPERKYMVSSKNGTDTFLFKKIIHDGSKPVVLQDTLKSKLKVDKLEYREMPAPEYENSGFYEPAKSIKQWHQFYAGYFPASKSGTVKIPTDWETGDIAIETEGTYSFYKCIVAHSSTDLRPANNPYFVKLSWDETGIRSDQPEWHLETMQSDFPPDDLRLKKSNYWYLMGLGFPSR